MSALRAMALALVLGACSEPAESPPAAPAAPLAVRVTSVRRGEIADVLTTSGETAALTVLRLASPVAGRITDLAAQPGDPVDAGRIVARVLPIENEAALHGFGVLASAGALDADERKMADRLARDVAGHDVLLRAPFAAVVAERLHNPGEQVAPSDALVELFDPRSLVVMAQVPVDASREVQAGQAVEISLAGRRTAGQVAAILAAVTPQALTVPVRIVPAEPLRPPLLHAAAECHIVTARHMDAVLVPRTSVQGATADAQGTVMVATEGHAVRRSVRLGVRSGDAVEVLDGLQPGELVLVDGGYALADGAAIAPRAE
jgi:multidrug efflux pump subunit AcrA (membrane-fusion protein)